MLIYHILRISHNESLEKIIRLLKSNKAGFLPEEGLARSLGITESEIHHNMKILHSLGYKIKVRPKEGYKLITKTNLLLPWEITDGLQTEILGRKIYYFDSIDSTQDYALKLALGRHEHGSLVIAERQTHGRGRSNRRWLSPQGGIWTSVLIKPNFEISRISLFPMLTSLALSIAIEKVLKIKTKLKWPNDVTLNEKKVAGILLDVSLQSDKIEYIIIGVGINFKINPSSLAKTIRNTENFYGVTTLVRKNSKQEPTKLLQAFLSELEKLYNKITSNDIGMIKNEWKKRSSTIGRVVTIFSSDGPIRGRAIDIDDDGALLISKKGSVKKVSVGDVSHT